MTQPGDRTESFVVRIWLERREIPGALPVWRGMVEHAASGKRRYVDDLDSIVIFMAEYIREWGVNAKSWAMVGERFRRLTPRRLLKRGNSSSQQHAYRE